MFWSSRQKSQPRDSTVQTVATEPSAHAAERSSAATVPEPLEKFLHAVDNPPDDPHEHQRGGGEYHAVNILRLGCVTSHITSPHGAVVQHGSAVTERVIF